MDENETVSLEGRHGTMLVEGGFLRINWDDGSFVRFHYNTLRERDGEWERRRQFYLKNSKLSIRK